MPVRKPSVSTTVARRALGAHLRDLRKEARLGILDAAKHLKMAESTIYRFENGETAIRPAIVESLCRLYNTDVETMKALLVLSGETVAQGWWVPYHDSIPAYLNLYLSLEASAKRIRWFELNLVPGLLQTRDYAQALFELLPGNTSEDVAHRTDLRAKRQQSVTRPVSPLVLDVLIPEQVLRTPVGGSKVMAGQLAHLRKMAELENVSIRVIPRAIGAHRGIETRPFEMLDFICGLGGEPIQPTTVYSEGFLAALYYDGDAHPEEVAKYAAAFEEIAAVALNAEDSRALIVDAEQEMRRWPKS